VNLEEFVRRVKTVERRAAENRALIKMLTSCTKVLEVKEGAQDTSFKIPSNAERSP